MIDDIVSRIQAASIEGSFKNWTRDSNTSLMMGSTAEDDGTMAMGSTAQDDDDDTTVMGSTTANDDESTMAMGSTRAARLRMMMKARWLYGQHDL